MLKKISFRHTTNYEDVGATTTSHVDVLDEVVDVGHVKIRHLVTYTNLADDAHIDVNAVLAVDGHEDN